MLMVAAAEEINPKAEARIMKVEAPFTLKASRDMRLTFIRDITARLIITLNY